MRMPKLRWQHGMEGRRNRHLTLRMLASVGTIVLDIVPSLNTPKDKIAGNENPFRELTCRLYWPVLSQI